MIPTSKLIRNPKRGCFVEYRLKAHIRLRECLITRNKYLSSLKLQKVV